MQPISPKCALIVLIIGILTLMLLTILNVLMLEGLFIQGVNWVYKYQKAQPQKAIRVIYNIASLISGPYGVGVILGIYFFMVKKKIKIFVHIPYFLYCSYIMTLYKQAIQQTRPIWYDSRIQQWDWVCPFDTGTPSGHATSFILLYEPILSDTIGYGKYRLLMIPLIVMTVVISLSRMYLGGHSSDQMLFGIALGLVFLILFKYVYQSALYKLLWSLFTHKPSEKRLKIMSIIILNVVTIVIPIIFFYINLNYHPLAQKDIIQINRVCNADKTASDVQTSIMSSCAVGCSAFGFILGICFLKNNTSNRRYLLGNWSYGRKRNYFFKILIYLLSGGIPFLLAVIALFVAKSTLLRYFLLCAAIELGCFGLTFFVPKLAQKFKIIHIQQDKVIQQPNSAQDRIISTANLK